MLALCEMLRRTRIEFTLSLSALRAVYLLFNDGASVLN